MKKMEKKKIFILIITIAIIIAIGASYHVLGMQHYQTVDFSTGLVTADTLNVRQGPGTNYNIIAKVYKNEYIRVFARIGNWYVIQTDKDFVGAVSVDYIKPIYASTDNNSNTQGNATNSTLELTEDEKEVFNLINQERQKAGLTALKMDEEVQNVARIKAKDMVDSNYFSHTSPIYGSPFEMLKNFKINYKAAGENIAGNSTNQKAVEAWMNSPGHKANILSTNYNYTGIGIVKSQKYGKIYVQMFTGK